MSLNGSGVYNVNSAGQPVVSNTLITAATFNAFTADIATALSTALFKDGQQTVTANIPFGGFKLTGVGAATARTDAATLATAQDNTGVYVATVGGTANAITLTPSPVITAYATGQSFEFLAGLSNTGATTIAISGLTATAVRKRQSGGKVALVANDIIAGLWYTIKYDGTHLVLEEGRPYSHGADIASAATVNLDTATGDYTHLTGTITCTAITLAQGEERTTVTDGAMQFTHGASLILLGGANITSASGDSQKWRGEAAGVVRNIVYQKANGKPVVASSDADVTFTDITTNNVSATKHGFVPKYPNNTTTFFRGDGTYAAVSSVWTTISTQTAIASATINFTGLSSTYKEYRVMLIDVAPATDNVALWLRTSTDGGVTYDAGASDYQNGDGAASAQIRVDDPGAGSLGNAAGRALSGIIHGIGLSGTVAPKVFLVDAFNVTSDGTLRGRRTGATGGARMATTDVDAIRFLMSSGNIASGTFILQGNTGA